ncbi:MAG: NAD(P)-dependent alcohol dehydrogenase [Acidimicrobiia bacterium]
MKAIVQHRYGPPHEVLELTEIVKPSAEPGEVLLQVKAASMHPDVWHVVRGWPYMLRLMGSGLRKPKVPVPGIDLAGVVESVGGKATRFRPGDEVFGEIVKGHQWKNGGAYAQYVAVSESRLEHKPSNLTFEQAAALPTSGVLALQGLQSEGRIKPGDRVLVNGAGGAVGSLAVQIAKALECEVTAVDSAAKQDTLRAIGADRVIDYGAEDFTLGGQRYDLILDIPGNRSFNDLKRVLAEGGRYVLIGHDQYGASGNRWFGGTIGRFIKLQLLAPFGRPKKDTGAPAETTNPLVVLRELVEAGKVSPAIDRTFPLAEVPEAIAYQASGAARGKIVITI